MYNMNKIITVWKCWVKSENSDGGYWAHNHISDGYSANILTPTPNFDAQKGWKAGKWLAIQAELHNGKVVLIQKN